MTTVHAFAAHEPAGKLAPFEYTLGPIRPDQVDIRVQHCGICHSDLSMLDNEWESTEYPLVPGHEVIGTVAEVGDQVKHLQVGETVGLGWHAGYDGTCPQCMRGDHNLCPQAEATIVGRHGGFADRVRAQAISVIPLPAGISPQDAGPLFCGGVTVFNPLIQFGVSPTARVGVIGIGGLGHLALQYAHAWGCHVTAFTSTDAKGDEAKTLGAHETISSRDPAAIEAAADSFDLLLSTVNVSLDWNAYVATLKPRGRLHFLGAVAEPLDLTFFGLLFGQQSVSASPVGSPATIATMLEFSARHELAPVTEHFPMSEVNEAMDHLRAGKARYRIVLDREA